MLRSGGFLASLRRRRAEVPRRRFNDMTVCYFASHVLRGWRQQGDGGGEAVEGLSDSIAADLIAGHDVLQRCSAVVLVEWEQSGMDAAAKVRLASSQETRRRSRDQARLHRVFRGMDAAFDALYRVKS